MVLSSDMSTLLWMTWINSSTMAHAVPSVMSSNLNSSPTGISSSSSTMWIIVLYLIMWYSTTSSPSRCIRMPITMVLRQSFTTKYSSMRQRKILLPAIPAWEWTWEMLYSTYRIYVFSRFLHVVKLMNSIRRLHVFKIIPRMIEPTITLFGWPYSSLG